MSISAVHGNIGDRTIGNLSAFVCEFVLVAKLYTFGAYTSSVANGNFAFHGICDGHVFGTRQQKRKKKRRPPPPIQHK